MQQGDSTHQPEDNHGQIEHRPPSIHVSVSAILSRFPPPNNRLAITGVSQGRLSSIHDEQLCDRDRKTKAEQYEPELHHARTSPQTGCVRSPDGTRRAP